MNIQTLIDAMNEYTRESEDLVKELESIRNYVNKCHKGSNILKTTGAVYGVTATVAAAGLLLAPLTGGLSLFAGAMAVGGTVGSVGTGIACAIVDKKDGKTAAKKIESVQRDHERIVKRLEDKLKLFNEIVQGLMDKGIKFDVAYLSTLAVLIDVGKNGQKLYNVISSISTIEQALKIGQVQKILAPTGIKIAKILPNGMSLGGYSVMLPSANSINAMTAAQRQAYFSLTKEPQLLMGSAVSTFGKVMFVAQVFFTIVDVALLIKSWSSDHPLVEPINNFMERLEDSIKTYKNRASYLTQYSRDNGVL